LFRFGLILAAAPAGLAAGLLAWQLGSGPAAASSRIEPVRDAVTRLRPRRVPTADLASVDARAIAALPLFPMTVGPGATPLPVLRLDGLARSRSRTAALLSINGKPAEWLLVGDTRDGVTLQEVHGGKVVVDTLFGPQDVALGQAPAEPPAAAPAGAAPSAALAATAPASR
jgi:hypothetical protein